MNKQTIDRYVDQARSAAKQVKNWTVMEVLQDQWTVYRGSEEQWTFIVALSADGTAADGTATLPGEGIILRLSADLALATAKQACAHVSAQKEKAP